MIDIHKNISKDALNISNILFKNGYQSYLVGGSIRDILMNKNDLHDYDIATDATPDDLKKMFKHAIAFGEKFGTILVIYNGFNFEITTFRTESDYKDQRHPEKVVFIKDIREDLKRRDFTMNAIAFDMRSNTIIDIFNGQKDIKNKIIKCVGDPDLRFDEDPLRLIRAVRFYVQLNFDIDKTTYTSIKNNAYKIATVSKERIRDEFMRMISFDNPSRGVELLRDTGLLDYIFPEINICLGVEQNKFHSLDVYHHLLLSMDMADKRVRLAALLHDIGKPQTKDGEHFFGHEKVGAEMADKMLRRLKFPKKDISLVSKLIYLHLFNYEDKWTDSAIRRFLRRVENDETLELLFLLREADEHGNPISKYDFANLDKLKNRISKVRDKDGYLSLKDLKLNGDDLIKIGYSDGIDIGKELQTLLIRVIEDPGINSKKKLLKMAQNDFMKFKKYD
ncbi:MAG: CCA tRNA nucleotidyltransferase [Patescibacteria group bacterium]